MPVPVRLNVASSAAMLAVDVSAPTHVKPAELIKPFCTTNETFGNTIWAI